MMSFEHDEATKPEESPQDLEADAEAPENDAPKPLGCAFWCGLLLLFCVVIEVAAYLWHVYPHIIDGGRPLPWYAYPGLVVLYYLAASCLVGGALGAVVGFFSPIYDLYAGTYAASKANSSNNRRRTRRSHSMLTNDAAQPVRDPQPESSIDAALGDAFTSQGRSNGTLASGPEGGSQGATPSSPRVSPL